MTPREEMFLFWWKKHAEELAGTNALFAAGHGYDAGFLAGQASKDERIAELEARLAAWENREPVAVVGASAPKKVGGIAYGNVIPWTDVPSRPEVVGMFKLLDVGTLLFTKLKEN